MGDVRRPLEWDTEGVSTSDEGGFSLCQEAAKTASIQVLLQLTSKGLEVTEEGE